MMNQTRASRVRFLILLSFVFSATTRADALLNAQRARRTSTTQKSSPSGVSQGATPTPTPALNPTPSPAPSPTASPVATPRVAPSATVGESQTRISKAAKSLSELQTRISAILRKPELEPAMVGIKVVSLDSGRVLF